MTPFLIAPTCVSLKKFKTASVNLESLSNLPTVQLPGLTPFSREQKPKPFFLFLPFLLPPETSFLLSLSILEISPTFFHNSLISSFHVRHSLKRCSRLCLPLLHHQHWSESTHPNLSLRKGAVMACPDASWKNRDAKPFSALPSVAGILGTVPSLGTLYGLRPLPPLMMHSLQLLTALRLSMAFMKDPLTTESAGDGLVMLGGILDLCFNSLAAASPAHWSAISFPAMPAWPGIQWMEIPAPLWHSLPAPRMLRIASCWPGLGLSSITRFMAAWESVKILKWVPGVAWWAHNSTARANADSSASKADALNLYSWGG